VTVNQRCGWAFTRVDTSWRQTRDMTAAVCSLSECRLHRVVPALNSTSRQIVVAAAGEIYRTSDEVCRTIQWLQCIQAELLVTSPT